MKLVPIVVLVAQETIDHLDEAAASAHLDDTGLIRDQMEFNGWTLPMLVGGAVLRDALRERDQLLREHRP